MSAPEIFQQGPGREPAPGYDIIRADCLFAGAVLADTGETVTSVQVTRSGYVLFSTTRYPNIPRMARSESLWRLVP